MVEKIEEIVSRQVEAMRDLKIDKVTVWDSGNGGADGQGSTAGFLSSLTKSLPPISGGPLRPADGEAGHLGAARLVRALGRVAVGPVPDQA